MGLFEAVGFNEVIFSMVILWWFNADLMGFTLKVKQNHEGETTHTC